MSETYIRRIMLCAAEIGEREQYAIVCDLKVD